MFTVVNTATGTRLPLDEALAVAATVGLPFVPVLERSDAFAYSLADLLEKAKGRYRDHFPVVKEAQEREGIVVRSLCGSISFKAGTPAVSRARSPGSAASRIDSAASSRS